MKQTMPTYSALLDALNHTTLKLHPAQVHGLISGILCGNPHSQAAFEALVKGGKEATKAHEVLQALYGSTSKQLAEFLFEFQLLLPSEQAPLAERAEALALWCQGFLTGLKMADVPIVGREKSEVTEAIEDIIEIAKMNDEEVMESEEDEGAYVELMEYVRMAVIFIYQDLRDRDASKQSDQTKSLH